MWAILVWGVGASLREALGLGLVGASRGTRAISLSVSVSPLLAEPNFISPKLASRVLPGAGTQFGGRAGNPRRQAVRGLRVYGLGCVCFESKLASRSSRMFFELRSNTMVTYGQHLAVSVAGS